MCVICTPVSRPRRLKSATNCATRTVVSTHVIAATVAAKPFSDAWRVPCIHIPSQEDRC
ncbi:hypothetical protein D9X30_0410 [Cupriavidus sp. U2]|nr:hypothetical protein D9X30_0410 [Cupriavidus sp. U2]